MAGKSQDKARQAHVKVNRAINLFVRLLIDCISFTDIAIEAH